jgi:hypothetical protein
VEMVTCNCVGLLGSMFTCCNLDTRAVLATLTSGIRCIYCSQLFISDAPGSVLRKLGGV